MFYQEMKLVLCITFIVALAPLSAQEADKADLLKDGATTIHYIWTEWMEKPKLTYTKITKESLKSLYGDWVGSYVEDEDKVDLSVTVNATGTWSSKAFRADMKDGHWYLSDGMILLFESELSDDADLASALTMNGGKLRLLYADTERGFVELTKAEPDGAANGNQPIRSETNQTPSAAGSRR